LAYAGLFGVGVELCGDTPAIWPRVWPFLAGLIAAIAGFFLNRRWRDAVSSA
jgi:hypothetical protein